MLILLGQLMQYDIRAFMHAYYVGEGTPMGFSIPNIQDQEHAIHPIRDELKLITWHLDMF